MRSRSVSNGMKNKNIKNILIVAVVLVGAFVIYTFFIQKDEAAPLLSVGGKTAEQAKEIQELLTLQRELKSIALDVDIFESAVFKSLKDYTVVLPLQPQGRSNPFAPF